MHHTKLRDNHGHEVVINHNSDWSGDAYVLANVVGGHYVTVPGWLARALTKSRVLFRMERAVHPEGRAAGKEKP